MKILFTKPSPLATEKTTLLMTELTEVLSYKGVEDMTTHLLLELDNEVVDIVSIQQLFAFFERWNIDKSPLESLLQLVDGQ
ncbi:MAG: hypothetical protein KUG55_06770 [Cycloclasticus sp.]|jgi:hypothetical protein|nr:hypothetical protein [Cycloclasticus sp.]MDF1688637.1 hypothetical protein [Cycloclasticus sp.]